jgi:hypothetical protein
MKEYILLNVSIRGSFKYYILLAVENVEGILFSVIKVRNSSNMPTVACLVPFLRIPLARVSHSFFVKLVAKEG